MNKFLYFFTRIGFWPYVFIFTVLAIVLSEILMLFQSYWLTGSWFDKNLMIVGFITPAIDAFIVFFLSALIIRHLVMLKNESEKTSLELSEQKRLSMII